MKQSLLTLCILTISTFLSGQEIKFSVAPTINFAPHYRSVQGGPGQNIKVGFSSSFDFLFINDKRLNFGFGLNYHFSQLEFVPNLNTGEMILHTEKVNLLSIRFKSVCNFKNNFYLSFDPSVDFHLNHDSQQTINNQSGIGLAIGIGKNIKIKDALYLNIEPKLWIHNIIPFNDETFPYRLTSAGLNFGLAFGR